MPKKNNENRNIVYSLPFHPHARQYVVAGRNYKRLCRARVRLDAVLNSLTEEQFINIIKQISNGCLYLEENKIIHRDLAARNCLLNEEESDNITVKISDLGLARDVYYTKIYTTETKRKLPFRWMAPESIFQLIFSSKSDVWLLIFCKYFFKLFKYNYVFFIKVIWYFNR